MTHTDTAHADAATVAHVRRERLTRRRLLHAAERYALVALLVAVIVFFCVLPASSEIFPTTANLRILAASQSVTLLLAVAALLPLVTGNFDFSVGAIAAASSVAVAGLMSKHDTPLSVCIAAGILLGLLVGAANGLAVTRLGMNSFVTTLATATLLGGLIQWYTGGQAIASNISPDLITFGSTNWLGMPRVVYLVMLIVAAGYYLLNHTPYGRGMYAIGENPAAARLVGIQVSRYCLSAFLLSGLVAGIAGVVLAARTGGATADNGTTMIFPALAAVFLGATAVQPGRFNVIGTVVGVALVAVSVSGLTLAGAQNWVNPVFNGAALAIAVAVSSLLGRSARGR